MIPYVIQPGYRQVRGDEWTLVLLLDPTRDWTGSTFSVDAVPPQAAPTVDSSSISGAAPQVKLTVSAEQTQSCPTTSIRWNLRETPVFGRTFLSSTIELDNR